MHILFTRPLEDCEELILQFSKLGHKVSHMPVIKIEKIEHEKINFIDSLNKRLSWGRKCMDMELQQKAMYYYNIII